MHAMYMQRSFHALNSRRTRSRHVECAVTYAFGKKGSGKIYITQVYGTETLLHTLLELKCDVYCLILCVKISTKEQRLSNKSEHDSCACCTDQLGLVV